MTMPEMARLLLITRSEVYQILNAARNQGVFQVIMVADKKRITKDSFEKWYSGQSKYKKLCDRSPEEQAEIMALQNCEETGAEKQEQKFLDKTVYTPQEVAELLDITYKDVLAMIKTGDIDTLKHGNKYLIHRDEIQWFLFQKKLQMSM